MIHSLILNFRVWLFKTLTPVLKYTATVHGAWTHKKVTGVDYYTMWPALRPGTIFATRIEGDLTTLLVPGHYSHAAMYVDSPHGAVVDESVVQAERDGVNRIDLVSFLLTKDEVLVLEPNLPPLVKAKVMARAAELAVTDIGDAYDFQFSDDKDPKAFYCSRLVWYCYDQACQEFGLPSLFTPAPELEVPTVTPQMVAECKNLVTVYHAGKP